MKGRILVINTGSTSTKIGFYDAGEKLFEQNLTHSAEEVARYESVMDQTDMRRDAIISFLKEKDIEGTPLEQYFVDHTVGVYPTAASGFPWNAASMQVKGDPMADLAEDLAAEATFN